ncbi:MAG: dephospho-CoA kinase [Bacteroidales bacterium]|nr:dephospho-CoA kinase [Bacteroidales bacterium]
MLKVGITGNIGSGKTWACRIFQSLGISVFYADKEAVALYLDPNIRQQVVDAFGDDIYVSGVLNRKKLASVVFSDPKALALINAIIHPAVMKKYQQWITLHEDQEYTLHEAAIIFEHHLERELDLVINVSAPESIRLRRVMKRDGISEEEVLNRMKNQWSDERKNEMADFVIVNDGAEDVIDQIQTIHQQIIEKNKQK